MRIGTHQRRELVLTGHSDTLARGRAVQGEIPAQTDFLPRCANGVLDGVEHGGGKTQRRLSNRLQMLALHTTGLQVSFAV